jgi:small subunit ribosomal protein S6
MRSYELIYIIHPDMDDSAVTELVEKVSGWITEAGGEITKTDIWGKRRLAYQIKKQDEGHYIFMLISVPPDFGSELERNLQLQESVMRYSLILA